MLSHKSIAMAFGCFGRLRVAALFALAAVLLFQAPAVAQTRLIRGEMTMSTTGGYGRLVVRLDAEIEADVRVSSGVLIVQFKQPWTSRSIASPRARAGNSAQRGAIRTAARCALRFSKSSKSAP
jgi:hypothetical protein